MQCSRSSVASSSLGSRSRRATIARATLPRSGAGGAPPAAPAAGEEADRADAPAALRVRGGDRCRVGDRGVGEEGRLDLGRADPVAGGADDVGGAGGGGEGAVLV